MFWSVGGGRPSLDPPLTISHGSRLLLVVSYSSDVAVGFCSFIATLRVFLLLRVNQFCCQCNDKPRVTNRLYGSLLLVLALPDAEF